MEFRLLGPFEARHNGQRIEVGSRRQERCLLAILLLEAGRIVPLSRITDLLWDGNPPASARGVVHTYVGRLRSALSPYGVRIATRNDGYLIVADQHTIDVADFTRMAYQAAGVVEPGERVRLLDQALDLWRGPFLVDLADERLRERLEPNLVELRLSSHELRAESQLILGHHDRVVADLTPLLRQHPTRERMVTHLMTALYRCARQADALSLYRATRQALVDELGIEPGLELRRLHRRMLRGDPTLEKPTSPVYAVKVRGYSLPWAVGGHPALEFCNTYAGWGEPPQPGSDWLRDYETLAVWTGYMDLAPENTVTWLLQEAQRDPDQARATLEEARVLRANLYAYLTDANDTRAFKVVAQYAEAAAKMSVFDRREDGLGRWSLSSAAGLDLPVHAAARAGAELIADPRRFTVRACPSQECGWLFLDETGMRRWCSMGVCGRAEFRLRAHC
ncbi:MAG: BTAD domain-containing putative transcriptional regulator [Micromonosporaceae bacterium]